MCLGAHPWSADGGWFTSLDFIRLSGEDFHLRVRGFGLPNEDVVFDGASFLLGEGFGGNWAGQSRGGS